MTVKFDVTLKCIKEIQNVAGKTIFKLDDNYIAAELGQTLLIKDIHKVMRTLVEGYKDPIFKEHFSIVKMEDKINDD
jgi:hypothetical protein